MRLLVLGAAAGGGFPQWNARHSACLRARAGDRAARPATQASIAVSMDGERWLLVNAAPDLRQQIEANPVLWPKEGLRSSPIQAVLLTNADVDAVMGLLHLREGTAFTIHAHPNVLTTLDANPIFGVLNPEVVARRAMLPEAAFEPFDRHGRGLGFRVRPFLAPGKVPLYAEAMAGGALDTAAMHGDALGLELEAGRRRVVYLANCARVTAELRLRIDGADLLFMDGTLWTDDEMIRMGIGSKTAARMGHVAMSGPLGAMAALDGVGVGRRLFIHVNNTNPALLADSPERRTLENAGWGVAEDGMELEL
jgi:pyrroloquinoline quinone biosynthesis protein B